MKWVLFGLGLVLIAGCDSPSPIGARIGRDCSVQIRRDLLGASAPLPVGVETEYINGASVSLQGTLIEETPDSVVLKLPDPAKPPREYIIPKSSILYMRFDLPMPP
jgi:hypothetical protein